MKIRRKNLTAAAALVAIIAQSCSLSAADLLRRAPAATGGSAPSGEGSEAASGALREQTLINNREALARANRTLRDIQRIQTEARAAALTRASLVPDGLTVGGLQVAPGATVGSALWRGAALPVQSNTAGGRTEVAVKQTQSQAFLTWQTFNIGRNTDLVFDQSAGGADRAQWIAFNQINDPSESPSRILGSIRADGQVYVINRNGVIFDGASQVNVRGLTVSSLPINSNLIERGLLNNPDAQFLFSGLPIAAGANGTPAFTPEAPPVSTGRYGDIVIEAGAILESPQTNDGGGRITLVGSNVRNEGTIRTPNGQTILAAGLQVGFAAHRSSDATLRGLDAYVGLLAPAGTPGASIVTGDVTNTGLIDVPRGSALLTGRNVAVNGAIDSTTSVALNGRIDLIASYGAIANAAASSTVGQSPFNFSETGQVALGAGGLVRILPESESTTTVAASVLALRSQINAQGRTVHLGQDSTLLAPNAVVNLDAGVWRASSPAPSTTFLNAEGQIYVDRNALVSVAGSADVAVPVSQNIIAVELRGAELADSPLQRNSFLRGQTVLVDIRKSGTFNGVDWVGTPLADVSGYLGLIERTVAELTTAAGQVNLRAGGSIVLRDSSLIDVSAGWINFQGGQVGATRLYANGRLIDIADARPDVTYDALYTGITTVVSPRWGVTSSYAHPINALQTRFESGYVQGSSGGQIALIAATMALDGAFRGHTTIGSRQLEKSEQPGGSSLSIDFSTRDLTEAPTYPVVSPTPPRVVLTAGAAPIGLVSDFAVNADGVPAELDPERVAEVRLAADLMQSSGLGALTINNREGDILLPAGSIITGPMGGALTLAGANIDVQGSVLLNGGAITLTAHNVSLDTLNAITTGSVTSNPAPTSGRGGLTVGAAARLDTSGILVNDLAGAATLPPAARNAGSVNLKAFALTLAPGSVVDVTGGYHVDSAGRIAAGDAGVITLSGGRDASLASVLGGSLIFEGSSLLGHADVGARAGSLSLSAPLVQIGGGAVSPASGILQLGTDFFDQGGFGSFAIGGIGAATAVADVYTPGVLIASDVRLKPRVENLQAVIDTEADSGISIQRVVQAEGVRTAVDLAFNATGAVNPFLARNPPIARGEVEMVAGARVETEAGGSISFSANVIKLHGTVIAPGGSIAVRGGSSYQSVDPDLNRALPTVLLGSTAHLDAAGRIQLVPDVDGLDRRTGTVYAGGTVTVSGNILARDGAVIDVSGTSGVLDLSPSFSPGSSGGLLGANSTPVRIDTSGGSIELSGAELLASDATLLARAGGSLAGGGRLALSSDRFYNADNDTSTTADINLTVIQSGSTFDAASADIGRPLLTAEGAPLVGGRFAADAFQSGGFDDLTLGGNVRFEGPVSIEARGNLRISPAGVIQASDTVRLTGGYVGLGQDFATPVDPSLTPFLFTQDIPGVGLQEFKFAPVHGAGRLQVAARQLDVGTLSLDGIGRAEFNVAGGDIRGNGHLNIAGDLVLAAGQIYPTTGADFNLTAFDYVLAGVTRQGAITVLQSGARPELPASAAGTLGLFASEITQGGTLRAPFGVIRLGSEEGGGVTNRVTGTAAPATETLTLAAGGVTSVSGLRADGSAATLPYGLILNGTSWLDPRGVDITLGGLPEKSINLAAADIVTQEGSVLDVRGGGDLLAYRFIPGTGGSRDMLGLDGAFAVIPGFQSAVAPFAPFNPSPVNDSLGGDAGYVSNGLSVGDRIVLEASSGLPAGTYTLLPARYALLPGAFLVTPVSAPPLVTTAMPDGSQLVAGQRINGFTGATAGGGVLAGFEIASAQVVKQRAEYSVDLANTFLRSAAETREGGTPRLPIDSGRLVFAAENTLDIAGSVSATPLSGGRGSEIDISSSLDIRIAGIGSAPTAGTLTLDAGALSRFGAASLLIGGRRTATEEGSQVTTTTRNLTVDNGGAPLTGADLVLVARENLTLAAGAEISSTAGVAAGSAVTLSLGSDATAGSGDGTMLRVASTTAAPVARTGVSTSATPQLVIGGNARISGGSVLLDSSAGTAIAESATISAGALGLNSGRISLVLDEAADASAAGGLILSGAALDVALGSANSLSLLSYSTIDLFGAGTVGSADFKSLSITAPALRRFGSGDVVFAAADIRLDNTTRRAAPVPLTAPASGGLVFDARSLVIGDGQLDIQGFDLVRLDASTQFRLAGSGGLATSGDLELSTPVVSAATGATQILNAADDLRLLGAVASGTAFSPGLGGVLTLRGDDVTLAGAVRLPSGRVIAEAREGDVTVNGILDVAGTAQVFFDQTKVTSGGSILLSAGQGSVRIGGDATLDLSAPTSAGRAGTLEVFAPRGLFEAGGTILAGGSAQGGSFVLDTAVLPSTSALDALLGTAGFNESRTYRVRTGDVVVDGVAQTGEYRLSADAGDITVTGRIDASGKTGGKVDLRAAGDLKVVTGAVIDASGEIFSTAGKGGSVALEAGAQSVGVVSPTAQLALEAGSIIDLSVAAAAADDATYGRVTGTLSLRAPRTVAGTDVRIDPLGSTILDASYVSVEGYRLYDLTASGGVITSTVQTNVLNDARAFLGAAGATTVGFTAMQDRLLSLQPGLASSLVIRPGAEIINRTGDLTLGTTTSTATSDWNLATFRFGPNSAPGVLTLRAAGDLVFHNALSDGFAGGSSLLLSPLMTFNAALPANLQTWDYRLTAGADLTAADYREVLTESQLATGKGSLLLGKNMGSAVAAGGVNATTASIIANNFQVIRTGSGDIDVSSGRNIRLQNPFASIYTAGTAVPAAASLFMADDFSLPSLVATTGNDSGISQGSLGSRPQVSRAQYSFAGGDVTLSAQGNIERTTRNAVGVTLADSSRQLPSNWLYRRSHVDSAGAFGQILVGNIVSNITDPHASTTWWVDFTNFFQGVGALGGGDVTLVAGLDIANMDAVIPTNARMTYQTLVAGESGSELSTRAADQKLIELGGGDLLVRAGRNIDGGVYYVQSGQGRLEAGEAVTTNATRSINLGILSSLANPVRLPESTWMPTTLFLGDATFDVSARGDVLLGPIANAHLLPQGNGNRFWYKTYFSTYGAEAAVNAVSLTGDLNLRNQVTLPDTSSAQPFLSVWLSRQNLLSGNTSAAFFQPWLRLAESRVDPFTTHATMLPPVLRGTAFSGDINLAGNFNLFPSATGTVELLSAGSLNALSVSGESTRLVAGQTVETWQASRINLSDADPASIAGIFAPLSNYAAIGSSSSVSNNNATPISGSNATALQILQSLARSFGETGATNTVLQTQQTLHASGLLHRDDTAPVRIYAAGGDFSGLTLFSSKPVVAAASRDVSDIEFYIQNNRADQVSVVSAGRDLIAFAPNSDLRVQARSAGNSLNGGQQPLAGDIQISGPGTLEVLAGRNIDLGIGSSNADGTATGITSIGNVRNPALEQTGADLFVAAGLGGGLDLADSAADFEGFAAKFFNPATGGELSARYLPELGKLIGLEGADDAAVLAAFNTFPAGARARLTLAMFNRVLRDAGRDHNDAASDNFGTYKNGFAAIEALFPGARWDGDISLTSRQIKTAAGGDVSLFAPGGELTIGLPGAEQRPDQGVLTEAGGDIAIFTHDSVNVGTSRIFTLRGGDILIWSSEGDIAAGSAAKTVRSAPPTRVVINPQSASVATDLSGLATGGGIGVLQTVANVAAGNVDLIAPEGVIDAGDAGIRSAGNLNLAAASVLNAANIQTGGTTSGAPVAAPSLNLGALSSANTASVAATGGGLDANRANSAAAAAAAAERMPSIFNVEVIGYGGGGDDQTSVVAPPPVDGPVIAATY